MHVGRDDSSAELEMVRFKKFARHIGVDVKQSIADEEENSFKLELGVAAHWRHRCLLLLLLLVLVVINGMIGVLLAK